MPSAVEFLKAQPVRGSDDNAEDVVGMMDNVTPIGDDGPTGYEVFALGRV